MSKLPPHTRTVYRGVKEDLHGAYPKGTTFVWWGFSSCTVTMDVLSHEDFLGTTEARTIFNIESDSGRDISQHSMIPTEDEVLLLAARQFRVISVLHPAKDLHIIQVREIEPPFPLLEPVSTHYLVLSGKPLFSTCSWMSRRQSILLAGRPRRWPWPVAMVRGMGEINSLPLWSLCRWGSNSVHRWLRESSDHGVEGGCDDRWSTGRWATGRVIDWISCHPTDVIVDRETLLICDRGNRRVMRWPRRSSSSLPRQGEIVIDNIACLGLTMDAEGALYVSDYEKHEVRRYDKGGDKKGTLVAGGHGEGDKRNQLNWPTYLFVDAQSTLYVSDYEQSSCDGMEERRQRRHRRGGWKREGWGSDTIVSSSRSVGGWMWTCLCGRSGNHRVMRWEKGAKQGTVIVGGNGEGAEAHQLSLPKVCSSIVMVISMSPTTGIIECSASRYS